MKQEASVFVAYIVSLVCALFIVMARLNSEPVFLLFYLVSVVFISLMVIVWKRHQLASIIIFDLFVFALFSLQYPATFQEDRDTGFERQYSAAVVGAGFWEKTAGVGYAENYYGYNPAIHLIMAVSSLTSGLSLAILSKWVLIIVFRIMFLLLAFLVLRSLIKSDKFCYIALLVYLITPRLRILYVSRRLMAALMILACLYALLRCNYGIKWLVLSIILSVVILFSDHTLSILWLIFLFGAGIFFAVRSIVLRVDSWKIWLFFLAAFLSLFIAYNLFISPVILKGDLQYAQRLFSFFDSGTGSSKVPATYSSYQLVLMYASQAILAVLAFAAFITGWRKSNHFLLYWSIFSFPALLVSTYFLKTKWVVLSNITMWFFLIPICLYFAIFLEKIKHGSYFIPVALLAVLFSGNLLLNYHPNVLFNKDELAIIELPEYKNQDILDSGAWLFDYTNKYPAYVIADRSIFDIYSAHFGFVVSPVDIAESVYASNLTQLEKNYLTRPIYFGSYSHTAERRKPDFVVVNLDILSNPSYEIHKDSLDLGKFEKSRLLKRIYQNERVVIYENINSTISWNNW